MSLYPVTSQIKFYTDRDGTPLNGYLYFGNPGTNPELTENRVQVYWDSAGLKPAAQPIRVSGGFAMRGATPSNVFANGDFAATATNLAEQVVYTVPNSTDMRLALSLTNPNTASSVAVVDAGSYYSGAEVETVLQEVGASLVSIVLGAIPTGVTMDFCGTVAPTGYVLGSGRTIGNAASNATERNHADTVDLYTQIWNATNGDATYPTIQDSAGNATTRGATAGADYAANKRLPLPDCRGRIRVGKDNLGGTAASRITSAGCGIDGTLHFTTGGTQTHVLVEAELAAHVHTGHVHTHAQTDHAHTLASHTHAGPAHTHSGAAHTHAGPSHTHTGPSHTHTIAHTHDISHTHSYNAPYTTNNGIDGGGLCFTGTNVPDTGVANPSTSGGSSAADSGAAGTGATGADGTGSTGAATFTGDTGSAGTGATGGPSTANTGSQTTTPSTGNNTSANTGSAGSGTAHLNVQPMIMFTVIIKL
jgi:hypothetical protein